MKAIVTLLALPVITIAATVSLSFDTVYDNPDGDMGSITCSDGENGMITAGFSQFDDLPNFPNIGGAPAITEWNSPSCGTCWKLTYTSSKGVSSSSNILAIDVGSRGFNIAKAAMNTLTNGQAEQLGRVNVDAVQVAPSDCGLQISV
ncbi:Heat-stable 19 kDa antigen [Leucoagaricus sp. SymC.cos]|nr:Heat-stable 19 kDa antigen [Leucoagaricus sp. SymC.cos]